MLSDVVLMRRLLETLHGRHGIGKRRGAEDAPPERNIKNPRCSARLIAISGPSSSAVTRGSNFGPNALVATVALSLLCALASE